MENLELGPLSPQRNKMVSPPGIMNAGVGKWHQTLPTSPQEVACPVTQHSLSSAAGEQVTPGSPELPQVASSVGEGQAGRGRGKAPRRGQSSRAPSVLPSCR